MDGGKASKFNERERCFRRFLRKNFYSSVLAFAGSANRTGTADRLPWYARSVRLPGAPGLFARCRRERGPAFRRSARHGARIVAHAREQTNWGTVYDPAYVKLPYPGGDLPKDRGVCTDVVIRALRAVGKDLQALIHRDRKTHPERYRAYPGQTGPDRNIDHRRCPNLVAYFKRHAEVLTVRTDGPYRKHWKPGDIVFWKLDNGRDHVGIVTGRPGPDGLPQVIHNLATTVEEPVLARWKIVGHFRYPKG